ncbi:MAG TPA: 16S rRNA (guanine(966)-N(2))-methyltransferase RsmD [Candidatus Acidoferrum sp.]|jgi:16S rRNA (guanine(966)-N(2))-methyltransferase RsmD
MRVIAGTFRSRQLKSLKGLALRPTSDRLRETLFNVLAPRIERSRFIDGFAGTGAIGIEAISRGATEVIFIENHVPAATLIQKNLDSLDIRSGVKIITADALRALQRLADAHKVGAPPYDIVFLDPPYAEAEEYRRVLSFLGEATFFSERSLAIAEHRRAFDLPEQFGQLQRFRVLRQGDACLSFYRFTFLPQTNFAQTKDFNGE